MTPSVIKRILWVSIFQALRTVCGHRILFWYWLLLSCITLQNVWLLFLSVKPKVICLPLMQVLCVLFFFFFFFLFWPKENAASCYSVERRWALDFWGRDSNVQIWVQGGLLSNKKICWGLVSSCELIVSIFSSSCRHTLFLWGGLYMKNNLYMCKYSYFKNLVSHPLSYNHLFFYLGHFNIQKWFLYHF